MSFGGPALVLIAFRVEPAEGGAVVTASEARVGAVDDRAVPEAKKGWSLLLDEGLKPYVERARRVRRR